MPLDAFAMCWRSGGDEFSYLYQHAPEDAVFKVLCKDAARFLHERLSGFHSVIAMSATLTPFAFYQDVLGFPPERTFSAEFPSPFPVENRRILVIPEVTTTYRERQREAPRIAASSTPLWRSKPAITLPFFPVLRFCVWSVPGCNCRRIA